MLERAVVRYRTVRPTPAVRAAGPGTPVSRWAARIQERGAARLQRLRTGHGVVVRDALLTLFLTVAAIVRLPAARWSPTPLPWFAAVLCPLVWRRKAPIAVLSATVALSTAAIAPLPDTLGLTTDQLTPVAAGAMLVALATVAAHRSRLPTLACAAVLVLWGFEGLDRWTPHLSPTGTALWLCAAGAAALLGTYSQTRRAYVSALRERAAHLEQERDQQAKMAVVEERARIARELHDIVSHNLSVIIALADGAASTAPAPGSGLMRQVAHTGRQAIGEMRHILGLLREDDQLDWAPQPGIDQLGELIAESRAAGLPTRLVVEGARPKLGPGLELTVYRIVQEALTNIRKHARGATHAQVKLDYRGGSIEIEVVDDGLAGGAADEPGHGLTGMGERAAAFAGSLEAGPGPRGGWRIRALLSAPETDPDYGNEDDDRGAR
jgi:signal transduction histidine kinase